MYGPVFTTEYKVSKFAESVTVSRPLSGEVLYYSNKPTEATWTTSVNMGEIRAGVGNPIVALIPSDSNASVEITDVNLSLAMRAYQTGGLHGYGAPTLICTDVTAQDQTLIVETADIGTPVAGQGFSSPFAYVQTVGQNSEILSDGIPYPIETDGTITGFAATAGTTYKVWFWIDSPTTEYATILANMDPSVVNIRCVYPVYSNVKEDGTGTRIGSLVVISPYTKLNANAGITGNGSNNATTSISGMAIAYEDGIVKAGCGACADNSASLLQYLYVPCSNDVSAIQGLYYLGGSVTVDTGSSLQLTPMLMVNGSPARPDPMFLTFSTAGTVPSGTAVSKTGLVTAGETTGSFTVNIGYTVSGNTFTCPVAVDIA